MIRRDIYKHVIENILALPLSGVDTYFYRTSSGAEIDLLLILPGNKTWAIEIKRSLSPKVEKGFHIACDDLGVDKRFVVYPGNDSYPINNDVEVISLNKIMNKLASQQKII